MSRIKIPEIFYDYKLTKSKKIKIRGDLISYSWPFIISAMAGFMFASLGTLVLGFYMGVREVGIYNAAVPLSLLIAIVPSLFLQIFLPICTKEYAKKI